jgi:hypothetical protein
MVRGAWERRGLNTTFLREVQEEGDHCEGLEASGRIVLKWMLKK